MEKKGLSTKKASLIFLPVIAILLILMIVATCVMNAFSGTMDLVFGYGKATSSSAERGEDEKTAYYEGIMDPEKYASKDAAKANASLISQSIVEEGVVMLKNEDNLLPLPKTAKITLLGADLSVANERFGDAQGSVMGLTDMYGVFSETFAGVLNKAVPKKSDGLSEDGWDESADYASYGDAAIVTIYRRYGEGHDADVLAEDGIRTELSLSEAELSLLDHACETFENVIVFIASSNAIEVSFLEKGADYVDPHYNTAHDFSHIKAAYWIGTSTGTDGPKAIAKLLTGEANPSGHLADTYVANLKNDPTYVNQGNFLYTNGDLGDQGYKSSGLEAGMTTKTTFVEFEEGIYFGYRYYETAAFEASQGNYDGFNYDEAVVYPFGYGLSYTTFATEYEGTPTFDEATNRFTFQVKVTNTGSVAGKEVVEIFCNQPYVKGGVEKAQVVLAGFAKTGLLQPGESQVVTVTSDRDYLCSYDYKDAKCYILDAGDYNFYLSENAHSWASIDKGDAKKCWTYTLANKIVFDESNPRPSDLIAAVNVMDDETNWKFTDEAKPGYATNFSRADFKGTFPTAPAGDDFVAQDRILEARKQFDPTELANTPVDDFVITGSTATEYVLADMRGVDFDDPKWDDFISQLSLDKLVEMYANGNWQTVADPENGIPRGIDLDGPAGLSAIALDTDDSYDYQDDVVMASSWNVDCASAMGEAISYEFWAYGFTGWYGPGMNLHRSAFCGRNGEYFSEDPELSGRMAVAECSTCAQNGMITYLKHFALNVMETNRDGNVCEWVNEQALRELYLANWERYMKDTKMTVKYYGTNEQGEETMLEKEMPAATAVMTAYNLVGATWIGAHKPIAIDIVRDQFGYKGITLTDAMNTITLYMDATYGLYTGATTLCLSQATVKETDNDYATSQLQKAAKYVLYNKANSNLLEYHNLFPGTQITYGASPWRTGLTVAWIAVGVVCAALAAAYVLIVLKNKKANKPEK